MLSCVTILQAFGSRFLFFSVLLRLRSDFEVSPSRKCVGKGAHVGLVSCLVTGGCTGFHSTAPGLS